MPTKCLKPAWIEWVTADAEYERTHRTEATYNSERYEKRYFQALKITLP